MSPWRVGDISKFGVNRTGTKGRDDYTCATQLRSNRFAETRDVSLTSSVDAELGDWKKAGARTHIEDATVPSTDHARKNRSRQQRQGIDVHQDDFLHALGISARKRSEFSQSGIFQ